MTEIYRDFVAYQGFKVLESLFPASCEVYKVEREGKMYIVKVGDQWGWDIHSAYKQVVREHEILERAKSLVGVPQVHSFRIYPGKQEMALLVKEYIEGKNLKEVGTFFQSQKDDLISIINHFHDQGMADLDIHSSGCNVLITPEGKPRLFDFGTVCFNSEVKAAKFAEMKATDLEGVEFLYNSFKATEY
ncbi:MAG TPA: hypothetical protein VJB13_02210 [Candidatus Nanoarchaeia archaeon]|nr:hypothetical protein [Candidatus Nanoarchaeia archaeon]